MKKEIRKTAFLKSLPIMCSYLFVGMAYGMMMQEAGFGWYLSLAVSMTVYTGAFQFVLITLLSSGASFLTIGITAFLMNSRQLFYGLTFLDEFRKMGRRKPYMICTLTDETYAVNLTLEDEDEKKKQDQMDRRIINCYDDGDIVVRLRISEGKRTGRIHIPCRACIVRFPPLFMARHTFIPLRR